MHDLLKIIKILKFKIKTDPNTIEDIHRNIGIESLYDMIDLYVNNNIDKQTLDSWASDYEEYKKNL